MCYIAKYEYDAWGNVLSVTDGNDVEITDQSHIAHVNPIRYRGYYYDTETKLYYLQSRYYNPEVGRFLNADSELPEIGGDVLGNNMFSYCQNNPIMYSDPTGHWPKWLTGALNIVSGALQMATGVALGATVGWTGVGAVAAGVLIANGAATATQGIGQVVNDITNTNYLDEENILRKQAQYAGEEFGGDVGGSNAVIMYDTVVMASSVFSTGVALKPSITSALDSKMPQVVNSRLFSHNNGYGYKVGKSLEFLYQNPNARGGKGGTFVSYNGYWGKYRFDWDPANSFHTHPTRH